MTAHVHAPERPANKGRPNSFAHRIIRNDRPSCILPPLGLVRDPRSTLPLAERSEDSVFRALRGDDHHAHRRQRHRGRGPPGVIGLADGEDRDKLLRRDVGRRGVEPLLSQVLIGRDEVLEMIPAPEIQGPARLHSHDLDPVQHYSDPPCPIRISVHTWRHPKDDDRRWALVLHALHDYGCGPSLHIRRIKNEDHEAFRVRCLRDQKYRHGPGVGA